MSDERGLKGVLWRQYAPEDPRHPRPSDPGLNTVHFNPSPFSGDVDPQQRHGRRRAWQKHSSAVQGISPEGLTSSIGVPKQGTHATLPKQSFRTPSGRDEAVGQAAHFSPMDCSPYVPQTTFSVSNGSHEAAGSRRMQMQGVAEQFNAQSSGFGGTGGGNHLRSENRRGPAMADPMRDREGGATSGVHQAFRFKSASSASLGSKLRADQSFESLASAFAACVNTNDGDGVEATQGIASAFNTKLHISRQAASKDRDTGKAQEARFGGVHQKAFSPHPPFSKFPAMVGDLPQRGHNTRRVVTEKGLPTEQKARWLSEDGPEVMMDILNSSSSLDSTFSSSENEEDNDLASEFASSILLGGTRQASISEPEIVAAMEQLWRMKDGIPAGSRAGSVDTRFSRNPAQTSEGRRHPGQGSGDGTQHGVQASGLDKADGRPLENASGVGISRSAARGGGEEMGPRVGTSHGVNFPMAEDFGERLQGAGARDGGQVKQSSSLLGQEARPVEVAGSPPRQQSCQNFGPAAWSASRDGWANGPTDGSAHTKPPFVFTSATEKVLVHRSPRRRAKAVFRTARSHEGPAAPAAPLSTLFGPASEAARPLGRQTSVNDDRRQQPEVLLQRSASVVAPGVASPLRETAGGLSQRLFPHASDAGTSPQHKDGLPPQPDPTRFAYGSASVHSSEVLGQQAAHPPPSAQRFSAYPRADVALSGHPLSAAAPSAWVQQTSTVIPPEAPVYARRAGRQASALGDQRAHGLGRHARTVGQRPPSVFLSTGEQVQAATVSSASPCADPERGSVLTQPAPEVAPSQAAHHRGTTSLRAACAEGSELPLPQRCGPSLVQSSPITNPPVKSPLPSVARFASAQQSPVREAPGAEQRLGGTEAGPGMSPKVSATKSCDAGPSESGMRTKGRQQPPGVSRTEFARPPEGAGERCESPRRTEGKTGPEQHKTWRQPFSQVLNPPVVNQPQGTFAAVGRSKAAPSSFGQLPSLHFGDPSIPVRVMRHGAGPGSSTVQESRGPAQGLGSMAPPTEPPPVAQPTRAAKESAPEFARTWDSSKGSATGEARFGSGALRSPVPDVPRQPQASGSWQSVEERRGRDDAAMPMSDDPCARASAKDEGPSQPTRKGEDSSKSAHEGEAAGPVPPLFFTYGGQARHPTPAVANFNIPAGQSTNVAASKDAQAAEEKPSGDGVGQCPGPFKFTFTQVPLPQASSHAPLRQFAKRAGGGRHGPRKLHNPPRFPNLQSMGAALPSYTTNSSIGDRAMPGNHVQQQKLHEGKDAPSNGPANSGTSYSIPVSQAMQQMPPVTKSNGAGETQAAVPPGTSRAQLASQEAEHVRRQGNEAFSKGQYAKSAELYGQAVAILKNAGVVEGQGKLQSNLAAAFLQLHKPLSAMNACTLAVVAEPSFIRARIRAVTCHMRTGDLAGAEQVLSSLEAALHNPDAVSEVQAKRAEFLQLKTLINEAREKSSKARTEEGLAAALAGIEEVLSQNNAPYCQGLLGLKASVLLRQGSLAAAATFASLHRAPLEPGLPIPFWPHWVAIQCYFFDGNLPAAADGLEALLKIARSKDIRLETGELLPSDAATALAAKLRSIHELKETGNRSFKAGCAQRAVEQYSEALESCSSAGPPAFVAVLRANRAAAFQKLKKYTQAIADCLCALALNPNYFKAYSRVAALLSEVGHQDVGSRLLETFLSAAPQSAEARNARLQLAELQATSRSCGMPDHYQVMGLPRSASSNDVRKEYKKLALRYHPDKALSHCRFAVQLEPCGAVMDGADKINARIKSQADLLFGLINQAHTILIDKNERAKLDRTLSSSEDTMSWMRSTDYSYYTKRTDPYNYRASPRQGSKRASDWYGAEPRGHTTGAAGSRPNPKPRQSSARRSTFWSTGSHEGCSDQSDGDNWDYLYR